MYTAFTRAKSTLFVFDRDTRLRHPFQQLLKSHQLIGVLEAGLILSKSPDTVKGKDHTVVSQNWIELGIKLFENRQFKAAQRCFLLSDAVDVAYVAEAAQILSDLRVSNQKTSASKRLLSNALSAICALAKSSFDDIAAIALKSFCSDSQITLLAARYLHYTENVSEAAAMYLQAGRLEECIDLYSSTGDFEALLRSLEEKGLFTHLANLLETQMIPVQASKKDYFYSRAAEIECAANLKITGSITPQAITWISKIGDIGKRSKLLRRFELWSELRDAMIESGQVETAVDISLYRLNDYQAAVKHLSSCKDPILHSRLRPLLVFGYGINEHVTLRSSPTHLTYVTALDRICEAYVSRDLPALSDVLSWYASGRCEIGYVFALDQFVTLVLREHQIAESQRYSIIELISHLILASDRLIKVIEMLDSSRLPYLVYQKTSIEAWLGLSCVPDKSLACQVDYLSPLFYFGQERTSYDSFRKYLVESSDGTFKAPFEEILLYLVKAVQTMRSKWVQASIDLFMSSPFLFDSKNCVAVLQGLQADDIIQSALSPGYLTNPASKPACLIHTGGRIQHRPIDLNCLLEEKKYMQSLLYLAQVAVAISLDCAAEFASLVCIHFWLHVYQLVPNCCHLQSLSRYYLTRISKSGSLLKSYIQEKKSLVDGTLKWIGGDLDAPTVKEVCAFFQIENDLEAKAVTYPLSLFFDNSTLANDYKESIRLCLCLMRHVKGDRRLSGIVPLSNSIYSKESIDRRLALINKLCDASEVKEKAPQKAQKVRKIRK